MRWLPASRIKFLGGAAFLAARFRAMGMECPTIVCLHTIVKQIRPLCEKNVPLVPFCN